MPATRRARRCVASRRGGEGFGEGDAREPMRGSSEWLPKCRDRHDPSGDPRPGSSSVYPRGGSASCRSTPTPPHHVRESSRGDSFTASRCGSEGDAASASTRRGGTASETRSPWHLDCSITGQLGSRRRCPQQTVETGGVNEDGGSVERPRLRSEGLEAAGAARRGPRATGRRSDGTRWPDAARDRLPRLRPHVLRGHAGLVDVRVVARRRASPGLGGRAKIITTARSASRVSRGSP